MSCLKLYWPRTTSTLSVYWPADAGEDCAAVDEADPVILRISEPTELAPANRVGDLLSRTRIIRQNRCCPECGRASVEPVESQDALMSRNHMPVPGAGELLGFRCNSCEHEWGC